MTDPEFVLVPKEPTLRMIEEGALAAREYRDRTGGNSSAVIYKAMLAASPQPPHTEAPAPSRALLDQFLSEAEKAGVTHLKIPVEAPAAQDELEAPSLPHHPEPHTHAWTALELDTIRRYGEACAIAARAPQAAAEGPAPAGMILPDGSAFAVASMPLPADHWLYAPLAAWDSERDDFVDTPVPILTNAQRPTVVAAIRYAVRGATMRGQEPDFDPDALVLNAAYALCGPAGGAVLPCDTSNPEHVICPSCTHQFRAIPVQVQQLLLAVGYEPPFLRARPEAPQAAPAPQPEAAEPG